MCWWQSACLRRRKRKTSVLAFRLEIFCGGTYVNSVSGEFCGCISVCVYVCVGCKGVRLEIILWNSITPHRVPRLYNSLSGRHVATVNFPFKTTLEVFSFLFLNSFLSFMPTPRHSCTHSPLRSGLKPQKDCREGFKSTDAEARLM